MSSGDICLRIEVDFLIHIYKYINVICEPHRVDVDQKTDLRKFS